MQIVPTTNDLNKQIGEQIEYIRLLKRKTVKEMMSLLELTESGYRNIERGITGLSVSKLVQIAAILNVDAASLLPSRIIDSLAEEDNVFNRLKRQVEEHYELRIKQYKEENSFLKKRIEVLENFLSRV
ncbi:MAG: helix-turn-helix transcriptional regulator [Chitinophagaceae bacterium]|nr:helix-turn-helix transcriptional regulator [Chitinophagaceae bacterium]